MITSRGYLTAEDRTRILGIVSSLGRGSCNRAALGVAAQMAPEGMTIEILELDGICRTIRICFAAVAELEAGARSRRNTVWKPRV